MRTPIHPVSSGPSSEAGSSLSSPRVVNLINPKPNELQTRNPRTPVIQAPEAVLPQSPKNPNRYPAALNPRDPRPLRFCTEGPHASHRQRGHGLATEQPGLFLQQIEVGSPHLRRNASLSVCLPGWLALSVTGSGTVSVQPLEPQTQNPVPKRWAKTAINTPREPPLARRIVARLNLRSSQPMT